LVCNTTTSSIPMPPPPTAANPVHAIELITTGGTIEKTYDEHAQALANSGSIVRRMLGRLMLPGTQVTIRDLMSKDSLDLTDEDRDLILASVRAAQQRCRSIVILHGTDTLSVTGELIHAKLRPITSAVVLTGAMRPFEMKRSDALQNLTEAILASRLLPPGVYCAMHGKVLRFPGVVKDRERLEFLGEGVGG
jgi:L-asparaginase